ncbi:hypothetical protein L6164_007879 [Bauhinia variegata]|uniref:Uncharacterized protein n=1 Tax=Bauhinia variegata TaxID=167791 RepID=A0ACB9PKE6_BAUVA|nr:hypothetical protein L6164_007879 [Bauhinia variegata]
MAANPQGQEAVAVEPLLPELIMEILLRLPVKALLRFQYVSKQVHSLISGADFAKRYLQGGFSGRVLLSSWRHFRLQSLDYEALIRNRDENPALQNLQAPPEMGPNRPAHILGSCNGLVSISMCLDWTIFIWNPSLGNYRIIQDSSLNGCSYGFGYDCSTDDYKIIKVFVDKGFKPAIVEVFSLRANSWKHYQSNKSFKSELADKVGTLASGSIYWLAKYARGDLGSYIIYFDVSKEELGYIPVPYSGCAEGWRLGVLGGCLSACFSLSGKDAKVWWMNNGRDAEDPWVELGTVPKPEEAGNIRDYLVPLCFASNGGALMIKGGLRLYVCNLKKNTCKSIYVYDDQNEFQGALLVESLVNPNDYGA